MNRKEFIEFSKEDMSELSQKHDLSNINIFFSSQKKEVTAILQQSLSLCESNSTKNITVKFSNDETYNEFIATAIAVRKILDLPLNEYDNVPQPEEAFAGDIVFDKKKKRHGHYLPDESDILPLEPSGYAKIRFKQDVNAKLNRYHIWDDTDYSELVKNKTKDYSHLEEPSSIFKTISKGFLNLFGRRAS